MERRSVGTIHSARENTPHGANHQEASHNDNDSGKSRKRNSRRKSRMSVFRTSSDLHHCVSVLLTPKSMIRVALVSFALVSFVALMHNTERPKSTTFAYHYSGTSPHPLMMPTRTLKEVNGTTLMTEAGYEARPRIIGYYFKDSTSNSWIGVQRLDPNMQRRLTHADMDLTLKQASAQVHLGNSRDYLDNLHDELEEGDCVAQYKWQRTSFPTCNSLHEFDLNDLRNTSKYGQLVQVVGNGYWRDVWIVKDSYGTSYAFKTMRFQHDWSDRNYDRHKRDALASERLTSSKNIVDIFGFCANSGIFEYADGGDMEVMLWYSDEHWNSTERLIVAHQVATAIADVHAYPNGKQPSIVHTDISTSQFVFIEGRYKLNDFNRCRFIAVNRETQQLCGFKIGNNPGSFRSPEEYMYIEETEKIDVYSMGNIFYVLVTDQLPFQDDEMTIAQRKIMNGERPHVPSKFRNSKEPGYKVLISLMKLCWNQNPRERPSARVVADMIENELRVMGIKEDKDV